MAEKKNLNIKSSTEEVGQVITLMERVRNFINTYGVKNLFTTILVLFMISVCGYFIINPGPIFERFQDYATQQHNNAIKARIEADPQIRNYLLTLKNELNADRVFILETHNGGSNLTNLPFLYVDLTYAEPRNDFSWLESEYKNVRLSRYPWASFIYKENYWYGDVDSIQNVDPELYYRLQKEDVKYLGMMMIFDKYGIPSSTLGVIFNEENAPTRTQVMKALQKYSTVLSPLLINEQ